tara:strand:- start:69 stop:314 length:246 start_codon:yes stop_codon:yes gene_type:complete
MTDIDNSEQDDINISSVSWDDMECSVMYHCKVINDVVVKNTNKSNIIEESSPCELCGSHGRAIVEINCRCGREHNVIIKGW